MEIVRDTFILIIGVILSWIQIKNSIKKKWKSVWIIVFVFLIILGVWQVMGNYNDRQDTISERNHVKRTLTNLQNLKSKDSLARIEERKVDSIRDGEFADRLWLEFRITRDTALNKPMQAKYNTTIGDAGDVYIGDKN